LAIAGVARGLRLNTASGGLGSNAKATMGAEEMIAGLAKEAVPPDLREAK
jgi:hypothetical protein